MKKRNYKTNMRRYKMKFLKNMTVRGSRVQSAMLGIMGGRGSWPRNVPEKSL